MLVELWDVIEKKVPQRVVYQLQSGEAFGKHVFQFKLLKNVFCYPVGFFLAEALEQINSHNRIQPLDIPNLFHTIRDSNQNIIQ